MRAERTGDESSSSIGRKGAAPGPRSRGIGSDLHPTQQAWLDQDVARCGFCQPSQIMAAVATVHQVHEQGRDITDADLDQIRNICRCGTYFRIRQAIKAAAANM